jgi:predicted ATP-grasp superfamily ATP-dependent carboligase
MLVIVWESLNDVIVKLQAEENISAYNVAVLATPTSDKNALFDRERIIERWQKLAGPARRAVEVTFDKLKEMLTGAFQEQIRS